MGDPEWIGRLRRHYAKLLDDSAFGGGLIVSVDPKNPPDYSDLANEIRLNLQQAGAATIEVRAISGELIGVATREKAGAGDEALAGDPVPVGTGDHASLPGESGQYRVIVYKCPEGHVGYRIYHDPRELPVCEKDKKTMGLAGWI